MTDLSALWVDKQNLLQSKEVDKKNVTLGLFIYLQMLITKFNYDMLDIKKSNIQHVIYQETPIKDVST